MCTAALAYIVRYIDADNVRNQRWGFLVFSNLRNRKSQVFSSPPVSKLPSTAVSLTHSQISNLNPTMAAASARITVTAMAVIIALATSLYCSSASASDSSVGQFVDNTISSHKIVIFSKTYCPCVTFFILSLSFSVPIYIVELLWIGLYPI